MKETKDSSQRLNKAEKSWILYDVANSAFIMIVTATIPIYFRSLAEGSGMSGTSATSLWGSATSISILILALLSPVLGAIADYENMKKKIFTIFFVIAIAGGFLFTFAPGWLSFLIFFIISRIGYAACNIFYDAMLIDVTTDERMDRVSTCGYAFGYIGSCIPFVAGLLLILNCDTIGLPMVTATRISFVITMVWWIIMSIPLYKNVHQQYSLPHEPHVFAATFKRLGATFQKLAKDKRMLFFIIGYFCYIDGVYTIISMATTYGGEVGIDSNAMVLALLLTQFVAFPCSILSGTLAKKFGSMRMIKIFIVMYMAICLFGYGLDTELEFWILAVSVGICQGGIQALSRSYYGKIIPKPMMVTVVVNILNIIGNYSLIFGKFGMPALGVEGAAISTAFARGVSMVILFVILFRKHIPRFPLSYFCPFPFVELKNLLKIGVPSAGENMSYSFSQVVLTYFINMLGNEALATRTYVVNIVMFVYLFAIAMAQGGAICIGHLVGERKIHAAYLLGKYVMRISILVSLVLSCIWALMGHTLFSWLTDNPEIIRLGTIILFIDVILEVGRAINIYATNALRATGDVNYPFYVGFVVQWSVAVGCGFLFGIHWGWGLVGMWCAFVLDENLRGIIFVQRWNSLKWTKKGFVK